MPRNPETGASDPRETESSMLEHALALASTATRGDVWRGSSETPSLERLVIAVRQETPDRWRAMAGFELVVRTSAADLSDPGQQAHLLGFWLALPDHLDWAIQLRIIAHPRFEPMLSLGLVVAGGGFSAETAALQVREVAAAVAVADAFLPAYDLSPIKDEPKLDELLQPFTFSDVVPDCDMARALQAEAGTITGSHRK